MATKKKAARRPTRKQNRRNPVPAPIAAPVQESVPAQPAPVLPEKQMKSIWFMVGLVLLTMGGLVFVTGVYYVFSPSPTPTAMSHLQPDLWWGGIMVLAGGIFVLTHRGKTHAV
jgi:hypothetical protein